MNLYDAARDFLYTHPWFQAFLFGSLIAVIGGGSFLHRRKERRHAKDLVEATQKVVEANRQANESRELANQLSAELLKVHKDFVATMQPEKEKIRPRLLLRKGTSVMVWHESHRLTYLPSAAILVDVNEDSVILKTDGSGETTPYGWPLNKVTIETDGQDRFVIVLDDRGIRSR
jgi:hypothetical protein